ncbi:zinc metallochaperone AztD [Nocardia australiensis]|uniref:zinc metallochaperone AztD n=1 Tax=Nocardia australiensis TaxID=2887191 RepID=UPI001D13FF3D|nr:zinc metallochaperone AztD [Nocardia australiensis]
MNNPIAITHDGGIYVLDGDTLEVRHDVALDGFNRVNPAGDSRHIAVSTQEGFEFLDAVSGTMTDITFPGEAPGHVLVHGGKTVLYTDGSGTTNIFDSSDLENGRPDPEVYTAAAPHHGVSVVLENDTLVTTLGTKEGRPGAIALDAQRNEIARSENCEGVHGEAVAKGEVLALGCRDGALLFKDNKWVKVPGGAAYAALATQAGSNESSIILSDYKIDPDAEREFPQQFALIDTVAEKITVVPMPNGASYSSRSLGRGAHGEGLLLGTDGKLHVVDPDTAQITQSWPVGGAWKEPMKWQDPRPALFARGHDAYITDPATRTVYRMNSETGQILAQVPLGDTPNEISGTSPSGH